MDKNHLKEIGEAAAILINTSMAYYDDIATIGEEETKIIARAFLKKLDELNANNLPPTE